MIKLPKLYKHQKECLKLAKPNQTYAYFMEQGLGKTRVALEEFYYHYKHYGVSGLLIIAPNGVHLNWTKVEIPQVCPALFGNDYRALAYTSTGAKTKKWQQEWDKLQADWEKPALLAVNVEALSTGKRAWNYCYDFLIKRRCMMVCDESSRIKTPGARRTKRVITLGNHAVIKRIMTGTPVTQSPFDLYAQFRFLDPRIIGITSFYAFKHRYGIFQTEMVYDKAKGATRQYEQILKYVNLSELVQKIAPYSYRRTKAECLDLPPKIRQRYLVELNPAQKRLYKEMEKEGRIELPKEGLESLAPIILVRLLRCQQITGGFLPTITTEGTILQEKILQVAGPNPKLNALMELIDVDPEKSTVIWARFRAEIELIVRALRAKYGYESITELHGGVTGKVRAENVAAFQDGAAKFMVGQQASGIGITLTKAEQVIYFSNTFSYEQRQQSEDRTHRIGTMHSVTYIDIEAADTIDEQIRQALLKSTLLADTINQDQKRMAKHGDF
jgi:SNF2 family DNA or RNA helicase